MKRIQYFCQNCVVKLKPHIWLCSVTSILTRSREEQDEAGAGGHSPSGTEPRWEFGSMGMALTHHHSVCGGPEGAKENNHVLEKMQRPRWKSILRKQMRKGKVRLRKQGELASRTGLEGFGDEELIPLVVPMLSTHWGGKSAFWKNWEEWSKSLKWAPTLVLDMSPTNSLYDLGLIVHLREEGVWKNDHWGPQAFWLSVFVWISGWHRPGDLKEKLGTWLENSQRQSLHIQSSNIQI